MYPLIKNAIHVIDFEQKHLDWAKRNLTFNNPEYIKKVRIGGWLGNTDKTISYYSVAGKNLIIPYGMKTEFIKAFPEPIIVYAHKEKPDVDYNTVIDLYDYQKEAVAMMMLSGYGILQSPPGSGKTQMGIAMAVKHRKPCLWITHTKDLLNQSLNRAKSCGVPDELIGTITDGKILISDGITFSTIQTLSKIDLNPYEDFWDVVIVDECHRVSGSPVKSTMFYSVLNKLDARHKYGLSATVHRADGALQGMFCSLGGVQHKVPDDVVEKTVMRVTVKPVYTGYIRHDDTDWSGMLDYQQMITNICADEQRNSEILSLVYQSVMDDKSVLVLTKRVGHAQDLMKMMPESFQKDACVVIGKTPKAEREQALQDMRDGKKKILIATYQLAKEGLDIPRLSVLIMATPERDYAVVTQSIGRVARRFEGKEEAIVYDLVDNDQYLQKMYKERCTSYRKAKAKIEQ